MNHINWIRRFDRGIIIPTVVFDSYYQGGSYYFPRKGYYVDDDGKDYDCSHGIILVSTSHGDTQTETILAHEWRHHWQHMNGWVYDGTPLAEITYKNYDELIVKYFSESKSEADAWMFSKKFSKNINVLDKQSDIFDRNGCEIKLQSYL